MMFLIVVAAALLLPVCALIGFAGCTQLLDLQEVQFLAGSVKVDADSVPLGPGEQKTLRAIASGGEKIQWTHSPRVDSSLTPETGPEVTYTAPAVINAADSETIAASILNGGATDKATVTLVPAELSVSPSSVVLRPGASFAFQHNVNRTANQRVTWAINPAVGSISQNGVYQAPKPLDPAQGSVLEISAVAEASPLAPTGRAVATVTLTGPVVRVNCGGPAQPDPAGELGWQADSSTGGGAGANFTSTNGTAIQTTAQLVHDKGGAVASLVYQSFRVGSFAYHFFGLRPGEYTVTLKFAELSPTPPPHRPPFLFDFIGLTAPPAPLPPAGGYDIFAKAGGNFLVADELFSVTVGATGEFDIRFTAPPEGAIINAIEITK